jgi:hypothetical protein
LNSRKVLVFLENINDRVGWCYPFLSSYKKKMKMKKYKKKIYQKIFEKNLKNNKSEKRMLEC